MTEEQKSALEPTFFIAEYNALRAEILFRATAQSTLLQINLTAQGTIAGFVLASGADPLALLVIPLISPILGMLWIDHHEAIVGLARFISGRVATALPKPSEVNAYPVKSEREPTMSLHALGFNVGVISAFGLLPLGALIYVALRTNIWYFGYFLPAAAALCLIGMFVLAFSHKS